MEDKHKSRIADLCRKLAATVVVLDIPDEYRYMDDELVELLGEPVERHIAAFRRPR